MIFCSFFLVLVFFFPLFSPFFLPRLLLFSLSFLVSFKFLLITSFHLKVGGSILSLPTYLVNIYGYKGLLLYTHFIYMLIICTILNVF